MSVYFLNAEFNYPPNVIDEVVLTVSGYISNVTRDLEIKKPFDVTEFTKKNLLLFF